MPSVIMLNVANNPFMLSVIMLNVVMPNVVAPSNQVSCWSTLRTFTHKYQARRKRLARDKHSSLFVRNVLDQKHLLHENKQVTIRRVLETHFKINLRDSTLRVSSKSCPEVLDQGRGYSQLQIRLQWSYYSSAREGRLIS